MENEVVSSGEEVAVENNVRESEIPTDDSPNDEIEAPEHENPDADDSDEHEDDSEKSIHDLPLPGDEDEDDDKKSDLPKWAKKRLEKKEREIAAREAELQYLREQNARSEASGQNVSRQQQDLEAPFRENFDTDEEFIDARFDYNNKRAAQVNETHKRQHAMIEAEKQFRTKFGEVIDAAENKYEDFDASKSVLFQKSFPENRAMAEAIVDSEFKSDILYFLDKYSDHAKKIALMNPLQAVKEITKLEIRFADKKKSNVTKAAKPLKPLNGNKTNSTNNDPNKMDPDTFSKWYKSTYG